MSFTSSSIFGTGGLGAASQPAQPAQPAQPSSIFSPSNPTSIFGNPPTTQAQAATSIFGGQPQSQQQQQAGPSSIFGPGQPNVSTAQPIQPASQGAQPAFFSSLLERGKKRPLSAVAQNGNFEDMPNLQLGLDDIRRKARELGTGGLKDPHVPSSKA
jgi:nuclear pore complex protein Nup93